MDLVIEDHDDLFEKCVGPFGTDCESRGPQANFVSILCFTRDGLACAVLLPLVGEPILYLFVGTRVRISQIYKGRTRENSPMNDNGDQDHP